MNTKLLLEENLKQAVCTQTHIFPFQCVNMKGKAGITAHPPMTDLCLPAERAPCSIWNGFINNRKQSEEYQRGKEKGLQRAGVNYSPQAKGSTTTCINKALLEHGHTHLPVIVCGCFHCVKTAAVTEIIQLEDLKILIIWPFTGKVHQLLALRKKQTLTFGRKGNTGLTFLNA